MATEVASLYATVGLDTKGVEAGQKKVSSALGGIGSSFKSLLPAIGIAAAVAGGIALVSKAVGFLTESVTLAGEEQAGMTRLGMAIEATGESYEETTDAIEAFIAAEGKRAALDDGEGRKSLQTLVEATGDLTKSMKLLPIAEDLAAAKGMDLATASQLVGKVAQGNVSVLTRYGIVLKKGATAQQALAELQKRYGGQAAAYANTYQGSMKKLGIAFGNLKETIGGALLPVLARVAGAFSDFLTDNMPMIEDWAGKVSGAIQKAIGVITKLWEAFNVPGDLGYRFANVALTIADMIGGPDAVTKVSNAIGVLRSLIGDIGKGNWAGVFDTLKTQMVAGIESIWPAIQDAWAGTGGGGLSMEGVEFDFGTVGLKEKIVAEWGKVFGEGGLADEIELWIKKIPGWIYDQLLTISVSLEPLTQKLKEWAENPANQEKLVQTAFAVTNAIIDAIKTFIGADNTAMDSLPTALQTSVDKNAARLTLVGMSIGKEIAKGIVAAIAQAWLPVYQKFIGTGIQTGTAVSGAGGGGGVRARAMGGDEWVTRPTLFLAGERGPERVTVTPQGKAGGGNNITFNITGRNAEEISRTVIRRLREVGL